MGAQKYQDLTVWQFAHRIVLATYRITGAFPFYERFLMVNQMRRAALSIAANIAEGFGRRRPRDKMHFYTISQGSMEELSYFYLVARDLGYVMKCTEVEQLLDSTGRMLRRLIEKTPLLPSLR